MAFPTPVPDVALILQVLFVFSYLHSYTIYAFETNECISDRRIDRPHNFCYEERRVAVVIAVIIVLDSVLFS
jgi:hypothetical protein